MKKSVLGTLVLSLLVLTVLTVYASTITIRINNLPVASDVQPEIKNGRTMVPLRVIAENFGAQVDYKDRVVDITTQPLSKKEEMIITDLLKHPELIPYEPVLGGKMAFYKEATKLLGDRWVFAYFEDGHILGHMLLRYDLEDGKLSWEVIDSYLD